MANRTLLIVFLIIFCKNITYGNLGPCEIAIVGIKGECISVFECQQLMSLVNKTNKTLQDKMLLKRSHCGIHNNAPAVCCPLQNEQPKQCYTPEGKAGQCLNLYSCPEMLNLLKPLPVPQNVMQFVQNSKCIDGDRYSVCCGPIPKFDDVKKGNCTLTSFPPDPLSGCCGTDWYKIYGGNTTAIDQYAWLALAEYDQNDGKVTVIDIGALISAKYVLTAASLAKGTPFGDPVRIRLGEYDTSNQGIDCVAVQGGKPDCNDGVLTIQIDKIIVHPMFNLRSNMNNIALIRLASAAPYTDFIKPICLPTTDREQSNKPFNFIAAGWGAVSYDKKLSDKKMHVRLPHVNIRQCQQYYSGFTQSVTREGQLCAGGIANQDTCQGYSTLMYPSGLIYEYSGIFSFGVVPCGQKNRPTVYTNVYYYNTWIRHNIFFYY